MTKYFFKLAVSCAGIAALCWVVMAVCATYDYTALGALWALGVYTFGFFAIAFGTLGIMSMIYNILGASARRDRETMMAIARRLDATDRTPEPYWHNVPYGHTGVRR